MSSMKHKQYSFGGLQSGAVSIFSVIFATLLVTVVTVSFVRLMIRDQQQASAADFSQSAYDSALAGVEDAKRLLAFCQTAASTASYPECANIADKTCSETLSAVIGGAAQERTENPVQSGDSENAMQQAYTCLKVDPSPFDYVGQLSKDQTNVIPLTAEGNQRPREVTIEWMTEQDINNGLITAPTAAEYLSTGGSNGFLPSVDEWNKAQWPAALQLQRITNDADEIYTSSNQWGNTLELPNDMAQAIALPSRGTGTVIAAFPTNRVVYYGGTNSTSIFKLAACNVTSDTVAYRCSITVNIPANAPAALLRITPLYRGMHYRVTMKNDSGQNLRFSGVQAVVDATGRASDVFRRVEARVDLTPAAPYPDAAVETQDSLCKSFFVTSEIGDYAPGACTP